MTECARHHFKTIEDTTNTHGDRIVTCACKCGRYRQVRTAPEGTYTDYWGEYTRDGMVTAGEVHTFKTVS